MIKAWDRSKRFALRSFAAARRAANNKSVIPHERKRLYTRACQRGGSRIDRLVPGHGWIHINAAPSTVEAHASVNQRKNRVIPAESDVFSGQEFCSSLAYDDIAGDDHFAAEFFHTQPFADAVTAILNDAFYFFIRHSKNSLYEG